MLVKIEIHNMLGYT